MEDKYQSIIGIEVHVELATESKMFCGCPADHFGKEPNTQTCPVCLGLPGALPVPNKKAVEWTMLLGLALGCSVNEESKFDRKHYFYPDLPKGYQISQYDKPLAINGILELRTQIPEPKKIRVRRVHLEDDTGKLLHATVEGDRVSLVDFNRSGVPLVEIVTEPDFRSVEEVDVFVKKLQQIVRYLGISGADMEKGSMRIEPSVSIRSRTQNSNPRTHQLPSYRVEVKNINSFKFARRAIEYEIERQTELLKSGETPTQQTRGYVESKGVTVAQREKEEAHDYRYFSEPDIPPMKWEKSQISELRTQIPELPEEKRERLMKEYGLSEYDATQLVETRELAEYFEEVVSRSLGMTSFGKTQDRRDRQSSARLPARQVVRHKDIAPKTVANWMINKKIDLEKIAPAQLLDQIVQSIATVFLSDDELENIIKQVLSENSKAVEDYKNGKEQAIMFLVGQAMRIAKGKSSAEILKQRIIASTYREKERV